MMPPDIASIESDISKLLNQVPNSIDKLSAMTPAPNYGGNTWNNVFLDNNDAFSDFSNSKGARHH